MKIVVCITQVPEAGEARFDAATRRLDRGTAPGAVTPFDRRAIALAVELTRRFGGTSTALTLGPPHAREVLVEALASGLDDAVHLCDLSCAGSDTLATARVLAAERLIQPIHDGQRRLRRRLPAAPRTRVRAVVTP